MNTSRLLDDLAAWENAPWALPLSLISRFIKASLELCAWSYWIRAVSGHLRLPCGAPQRHCGSCREGQETARLRPPFHLDSLSRHCLHSCAHQFRFFNLSSRASSMSHLSSSRVTQYGISYHVITTILNQVELSPPAPIPVLAESYRDFSLPTDADEARSLLVEQRTSEPGYRQPDQQKRHVFRSKKTKEAKCNPANWVFTKHEVARAFDQLLSRETLPGPGVAQALLSHVFISSLEELWRHFHDPRLEKRTEDRSSGVRSPTLPKSVSSVVFKATSIVPPESTSVNAPPITWLEHVFAQDDGYFLDQDSESEYIGLMCQAGLSQAALDRAFEHALSTYSMPTMRILLSFGAAASAACQQTIRDRLNLHDVALIKLLLSAPNGMGVEEWRTCLEPEIKSVGFGQAQSADLLLMCLAQRPEIICTRLLLQALESQNLSATAIMLAYGRFSGFFLSGVRDLACEFATRVQDNLRRHKFFTVLIESELVMDSLVLREELMKDVKSRQLPLIKLLADAGVIVDMEPHNAFEWAISQMDFEILELLKHCKFSSSISSVLKLVPDSTSGLELLRLVGILGPLGLAGEQLDSRLVCAVLARQTQLVDAMIRYGASIEFEGGSSVRIALANADLEILGILLRSECSTTILSATIPLAMVLKPRSIRLQAIDALVQKGVRPEALADPLQSLVSEDGDVDSELIQLLLRYDAPVDEAGDGAQNVVLVAARRGNFSILNMLCDARPRTDILSQAVLVAFGVIDTCGPDVALDMIRLLLQKGANGQPIHLTLLSATKQCRLRMVSLLIEYGADANYLSGASFGIALTTSNLELLQILCSKCPPNRASLESKFFVAIDPARYFLEALELLLSSTRPAGAALDYLWSTEKLSGNPHLDTIIPCLLRHGLDVNFGNGEVPSFAIHEKNVALLDGILSAIPNITSLSAAFESTASTRPRSLELEFMKLLLEKAKSAEIGQSGSLLRQIHYATSSDLSGLRLLLCHNAVATHFTLKDACLKTASSKISWDEKQEIFESLLATRTGVSTKVISELLALSVTKLPESTQLPKLLLAKGATVEFETLQSALKTSSLELSWTLLGSINRVEIRVKTFKYAHSMSIASDRKYSIYQRLLDQGIPRDDVSEALIHSLRAQDLGDLSLVKLLLEKGASPCYLHGKPFSLAFRKDDPNSLFAVRLLTQYIADDDTATVAFDVVRGSRLLSKSVRMDIYRLLLEWNISKSSVSQALVDSFSGECPNISTLRLLLEKGADPSKSNGRCFVTATKMGERAHFQALSQYAKSRVVLKVLLDTFIEEQEVVRWFEVCLEQQPRGKRIDRDELLFECMRRFPAGTRLLKLLIERGVSPAAKIDHRLCAGWKPESCTALIWALFQQQPRIENKVILVLLSRGDAGMLHMQRIVFPHN